MSNRVFIIKHEGKNYRGEVATIESTHLDLSRGFLFAALQCSLHGGSVEMAAPATNGLLADILSTVGVNSWEELPGSSLFVLLDGPDFESRAVGVAHLTDGDKVVLFTRNTKAASASTPASDPLPKI